MYKPAVSALAIALTLGIFVPYIRSILAGKTKPHVFSWIIWGVTTVIVAGAQLVAGAGIGAWPIALSGTITMCIAALAYRKRADCEVTRADWIFFLAALSALPAWFLTSDPLWAVIILTAVDLLGFGPTLRKANTHPHDEDLTFFGLFALRNTLVIVALERYSLATVLFPAAIAFACLALVVLIALRRRTVPAS